MNIASWGALRPSTFALPAINLVVISLLAQVWWWGMLAGLAMAGLMLWRSAAASADDAARWAGFGCQLHDLVAGVLPLWERNVALADSQSQAAVDALVQRFAGLRERLLHSAALSAAEQEPGLAPTEQERRAIGQQLNELLMYLQFQDRVSQILGHVRSDMLKLDAVLAGAHNGGPPPALPSREAWLFELQRSYTTLEQQALHPDGTSTAPGSQVTFF